MKRATFGGKKRKWSDAAAVRDATYDWIRGRVQSGDTEEINRTLRKSLKLTENAFVGTDGEGYLFVQEADNIVAVYHPTHKAPEQYIYKPLSKRVQNKKWNFWSEFGVNPKPPVIVAATPDGENLFERLDKNLLQYLFNFCSIREILKLRLVCKDWNKAICGTSLWTPRLDRIGINTPGGVAHPFEFMKLLFSYHNDSHLLAIARCWIMTYKRELKDVPLEIISTPDTEVVPGQSKTYLTHPFGANKHCTCIRAAGFFTFVDQMIDHQQNVGNTGAIVWVNTTNNLKIASDRSYQREITQVSKWLRLHMVDFCDSVYSGNISL